MDVIRAVDGTPVTTVEAFLKALPAKGTPVTLTIRRNQADGERKITAP
jgi:C-terminal processing protease CtpA/Prc